MRWWLWVCLLTFGLNGRAQTGDWRRLMVQAAAFDGAGQYAEAAAEYRRAVHLVEQSSSGDGRLPGILNALASASINLGDFREAERQYRRALSLVEATAGKESADYALLLGNPGSLYSEQGQQVKAESILREALDIDSAALGANDARTASVGNSLAQVLLARGKYREAETLLVADTPVLDGQPPPCADCLLSALSNLGTLRFHQGRLQEATDLYERSLVGFEAALGTAHRLLLRPLNNLARVYVALGRTQEAEATFRRAVSIAEASLKIHPDCAVVLANFAAFLRQTGRRTEAKAWEGTSQAALQDYARDHGIGMTVDKSAFK
jgi:tetratricopeptide (TPR) repeat protein